MPKHTPSHHIITIHPIQDIINRTTKHTNLVYLIQLYLSYLNLAPKYIDSTYRIIIHSNMHIAIQYHHFNHYQSNNSTCLIKVPNTFTNLIKTQIILHIFKPFKPHVTIPSHYQNHTVVHSKFTIQLDTHIMPIIFPKHTFMQISHIYKFQTNIYKTPMYMPYNQALQMLSKFLGIKK